MNAPTENEIFGSDLHKQAQHEMCVRRSRRMRLTYPLPPSEGADHVDKLWQLRRALFEELDHDGSGVFLLQHSNEELLPDLVGNPRSQEWRAKYKPTCVRSHVQQQARALSVILSTEHIPVHRSVLVDGRLHFSSRYVIYRSDLIVWGGAYARV